MNQYQFKINYFCPLSLVFYGITHLYLQKIMKRKKNLNFSHQKLFPFFYSFHYLNFIRINRLKNQNQMKTIFRTIKNTIIFSLIFFYQHSFIILIFSSFIIFKQLFFLTYFSFLMIIALFLCQSFVFILYYLFFYCLFYWLTLYISIIFKMLINLNIAFFCCPVFLY